MAAARPGHRWRGLLPPVLAALVVALLLRTMVVEPYRVPGGSMAPTLVDGDVVLVSRLAYGLRLPLVGLTLVPLAVPRRGDVVVFRDPAGPDRLLVLRVIGVAGDLVELREQRLLVGGVVQPRRSLGERAYAERDEAGVLRTDTCRVDRELLALGPLVRPAGDGAEAQAEAWTWAAARGSMGHELLQCRRSRPGRNQGPWGPVPRGHLFLLGDNRDRSGDGRDGGWFLPVDEVIGRVALVGWGWGPGGWWFGRRTVEGVRIDRLLKPVE